MAGFATDYHVIRLDMGNARDRTQITVPGCELWFHVVPAPITVCIGSRDADPITIDRPGRISRPVPLGAVYLSHGEAAGVLEIIGGELSLDFDPAPVPAAGGDDRRYVLRSRAGAACVGRSSADDPGGELEAVRSGVSIVDEVGIHDWEVVGDYQFEHANSYFKAVTGSLSGWRSVYLYSRQWSGDSDRSWFAVRTLAPVMPLIDLLVENFEDGAAWQRQMGTWRLEIPIARTGDLRRAWFGQFSQTDYGMPTIYNPDPDADGVTAGPFGLGWVVHDRQIHAYFHDGYELIVNQHIANKPYSGTFTVEVTPRGGQYLPPSIRWLIDGVQVHSWTDEISENGWGYVGSWEGTDERPGTIQSGMRVIVGVAEGEIRSFGGQGIRAYVVGEG